MRSSFQVKHINDCNYVYQKFVTVTST